MSIEKNISLIISQYLPNDPFKDVIEYSLYPAGKLFRSKLIIALAEDLEYMHSDIYELCAAIECHHTYSLIHDDLPCMDDDDYRRGKLSSHKKYNEALATLAGDSLLNLSYEILSNIKSINTIEVLKSFSSLCGPKGLILGQVMDLRGHKNTLKDTLILHTLKTSNLIEAALNGLNILANSKIKITDVSLMAKHIGIVFQLIDDLLDLKDDTSLREKEVNPFVKFETKAVFFELNASLQKMNELFELYKLNNVKSVLNEYFDNMKNKLENQKSMLLKHIDFLDIPIMGLS